MKTYPRKKPRDVFYSKSLEFFNNCNSKPPRATQNTMTKMRKKLKYLDDCIYKNNRALILNNNNSIPRTQKNTKTNNASADDDGDGNEIIFDLKIELNSCCKLNMPKINSIESENSSSERFLQTNNSKLTTEIENFQSFYAKKMQEFGFNNELAVYHRSTNHLLVSNSDPLFRCFNQMRENNKSQNDNNDTYHDHNDDDQTRMNNFTYPVTPTDLNKPYSQTRSLFDFRFPSEIDGMKNVERTFMRNYFKRNKRPHVNSNSVSRYYYPSLLKCKFQLMLK